MWHAKTASHCTEQKVYMSLEANPSSAPPPRNLSGPVAAILFWLLLAAVTGLIAVAGPILTSDGPAHVTIAHAIVVAGDPAWPMVNRLYEINPALTPNALGHFLLAGLMMVMPPAVAEQSLQILCVAGILLSGRLVLRHLNPSATWLALFFFPVALQATFLMGLYNYCLSIALCL